MIWGRKRCILISKSRRDDMLVEAMEVASESCRDDILVKIFLRTKYFTIIRKRITYNILNIEITFKKITPMFSFYNRK
jgi:hypothetical protein